MNTTLTVLDILLGVAVGVGITVGAGWAWKSRRDDELDARDAALAAARMELDRDRRRLVDEVEAAHEQLSARIDAAAAELLAEREQLDAALEAAGKPLPGGRHLTGHAQVRGADWEQYNRRAFAHLNEQTGAMPRVGAAA